MRLSGPTSCCSFLPAMTGTVLTDGEDEPRVVRPVRKIKPTAALLQHSEKAALPSQTKAINDFRAAEATKRASEVSQPAALTAPVPATQLAPPPSNKREADESDFEMDN
ncbi:hypothetical protein P692DRAFT_20875468 [Suillus brevipes Sb2]|nr:hypothetical protein P692DRAFT_20875468 [Suillus brevipes Sb2]